jgi:phage terminase small subunit
MLAKPSVKAALAERQDQIAARLEVTVERVLKEQAAIAFSDPRKLFHEDGSLKAVHELDDATAASLSAIEVETQFETGPDGKKPVGELHKIKRWDKGKALEHLSRFLGILKDDSAPPPVVGPGLVVMVQQTVAVQGDSSGAPVAAAQRVEVRLPLPGPHGS